MLKNTLKFKCNLFTDNQDLKYTDDCLRDVIDQFNTRVATRTCLISFGGSEFNDFIFDQAAASVESVDFVDGKFVGDARVLTTPGGHTLSSLLDDGCDLRFSIAGQYQ